MGAWAPVHGHNGQCRPVRCGVVVSDVGLISEVNLHRARLVLGWVTVLRLVNHLHVGMYTAN